MTTANTSTVIALFESRAAAERAVDDLLSGGLSRDQISLLTSDNTSPGDVPNIAPLPETGSGMDPGGGAAVGGLAGFIGGLVALAIPGIGPALAIGPLAAGIMGAGIGAAAGGLVGALKGYGVPEDDASRISDAVKRGRALISVHVPDERTNDVADVLERRGAVDVDETEVGVDPRQGERTPIRPASPEALEAARLREGEGMVDKYVVEKKRRVSVYPGFTGMGRTT